MTLPSELATAQYVYTNIIVPALNPLDLPNPKAASQLLLGTAAVESKFKYIKQISGPAVSIFQLEPFTIKRLCNLHPVLFTYTSSSGTVVLNAQFDHILAARLARYLYYSIPAPLPVFGDIADQAFYWKQYYNTYKGKGTVKNYIKTYNALCEGVVFNEFDKSPIS